MIVPPTLSSIKWACKNKKGPEKETKMSAQFRTQKELGETGEQNAGLAGQEN